MRTIFCLLMAFVLSLVVFSDNAVQAQGCDKAAKAAKASSACENGVCRQPVRKAAKATANYFRECKPVRRVASAPVRFFHNRKPVRRAACGVVKATRRVLCGCNCSR